MEILISFIQQFLRNFSTYWNLEIGQIFPLFKGKGLKANYKENYRSVTLFPTICKVYEIILLRRLEKFASDLNFFLQPQCGFQEGVGCVKASFKILETIYHFLERCSRVYSCIFYVHKAFDTVCIDGLLYKFFIELTIKGRMWLVLKDLYSEVKARVLFDRIVSRPFSVTQRTGQGRVLATFMKKFISVTF